MNEKINIKDWLNSSVEDWPHLPPNVESQTVKAYRPILILLATLLGGTVGSRIADTVPGGVGWNDTITALMFAVAGGNFAAVVGRRLCGTDKKKLTGGLWNTLVGGASLGLGIAALTAVPLLSLLDGGIIGGTVLVPTGVHLISNYRGRNKPCPWCKKKQSCEYAVCRNCLRIFYPADLPDCSKKFDLDWFDVASFLERQGLNYLDAIDFVSNEWTLPIDGSIKEGTASVDCEAFMKWATEHKQVIRKYRKKNKPSASTDDLLKDVGV